MCHRRAGHFFFGEMQDNSAGGSGGVGGQEPPTEPAKTKKVLRPLGKLHAGLIANAALKATLLSAINKSKGKF